MTFEEFKKSPLAPKVTRCFQHYSSEQRASLQANHRAGHRQRTSTGEFFYVREDRNNIAFRSRDAALRSAWSEFLVQEGPQAAA